MSATTASTTKRPSDISEASSTATIKGPQVTSQADYNPVFNYILPADEYSGWVHGIKLKWSNKAKERLIEDARDMGVLPEVLKAATEHVSFMCGRRIAKWDVRIVGSFHNTTTVSRTGETFDDECHCSLKLYPGNGKAHVYISYTTVSDGTFAKFKVGGESIVMRGRMPDNVLSCGTFPLPGGGWGGL